MAFTVLKPLREIAVELPEAIWEFEKLGTDDCSRRAKTLAEACLAAHVSAEKTFDQLPDTALAAADD